MLSVKTFRSTKGVSIYFFFREVKINHRYSNMQNIDKEENIIKWIFYHKWAYFYLCLDFIKVQQNGNIRRVIQYLKVQV